jgi:CDP-6-deoxy-D-xylo-4-hexulose-3-dehydrase
MKELENTIKYLIRLWAENKEKRTSDKVQYSGPVIGANEYEYMMDAIFNDWWSGGKYTIESEDKISIMSKRNYSTLTNSGSSANLLLLSAAKEIYFNDYDKIITLACGFPTTVNPIIQNNLIPVFVDISLDNFSVDTDLLIKAIESDKKIKGIFIPHHLGFYGDINKILDISRAYNITTFFDCCDSYGSTYNGNPLSYYGKASTMSFYVAHHITMGEGGAVTTNDEALYSKIRGMRNWGRYCSSNKCCIRSTDKSLFCPSERLTKNCDLPEDYTVNYQYEWIGYNLKPLELQSAILSKQLDRMEEFNIIRKRNYKILYDNLKTYNMRTWELNDGVSPFAFPILLNDNNKYKRKHMINFLKNNKIESRLLFAGNLTRHPAYHNKNWDIYGSLKNSDKITNDFIMLGVSHYLNEEKVYKIVDAIKSFFNEWGEYGQQ